MKYVSCKDITVLTGRELTVYWSVMAYSLV